MHNRLKLKKNFELHYGYLNQNLFELAKNTMIYNIFKKKYFKQKEDDYKRRNNLLKVEKNLRNLLKKINYQDKL